MVLLYLIVGPCLSAAAAVGSFTSPLVFPLPVGRLLSSGMDTPRVLTGPPDAWLELHAAISIVAYGAFALAGVAGVMYLAQERQLQNSPDHSFFYHLPPIRDLAVAMGAALAGFICSRRMLAGFAIGSLETHLLKITWSVGVWLLYVHSLAGQNAGG
jgi:ABC-type uncharacterized transport system permease subunit